MKTVIIHGQSHKGSTYHIVHELAEKIGGEITEFFLPRDFGGMFYIMRMMQKEGWNNRDVEHWKEQGWIEKKRPWKL